MDATKNMAQSMPIDEKGYVISVCDEYDAPYITGALHIERNDSLKPWEYATDAAAARGAEQDGIRLIYDMDDVEDGVYLDTPENREAIKSFLECLKLNHMLPDSPGKMPIRQQLEMYAKMANAHTAADRPAPERVER